MTQKRRSVSRKAPRDPLDIPVRDRLNVEDVTWLVLVLVAGLCAIVIFVLGLWTAGHDLKWLLHLWSPPTSG